MQAVLLQERLDVTQKSRANLFNWRGQFTPQLIEYLLSSYSNPGDIIADPFSGSGTVLLESIGKDLSCFGMEINPAAYVMSKFYAVSNFDVKVREDFLSCLEDKIFKLMQPHRTLSVLSGGASFRDQYKNLIQFTADLIPSLEAKLEKVVALNTLFICEGHKNCDLGTSVLVSLNQLKKFALSLPFTSRIISAHLGDARTVHLRCPVRPNLIITSPPYINVFNYHQNHRAILEAVGWDMLNVAQSEFGANRKNRGNRFKTVIQYCLDMEQALHSFWHCLEENGLLVLVIGRESNVRGLPFFNGQIVKEIIEGMSGFESVSDHERVFTNRFGEKIKEDIIVSRRLTTPPDKSAGKQVAIKHLDVALKSAPPDVKDDVLNAIADADAVIPSPLFAVRKALRHA